MKKIAITLFVFTLSLYAVAQQVAVNYKPAATIASDDAALPGRRRRSILEKIKKDKPVTHEFTFTNSGKAAWWWPPCRPPAAAPWRSIPKTRSSR